MMTENVVQLNLPAIFNTQKKPNNNNLLSNIQDMWVAFVWSLGYHTEASKWAD